MKFTFKGILFTGILAMSANTVLIAQTSNPWFEGWYRAKYGRPAPTEEARIQAAQASTAYRAATPHQVTAPADTRFENWYRAKYGRPAPSEEARIQAEQATTAYREATPRQAAAPANTWFENWYRDKYGRPSPQEEARVKDQSR